MKIVRRIFLVLAFVLLFAMPFHAETKKTISKSTKKIEMTAGQKFRVKIKGGASARWIYKSNSTLLITNAGLLKARRAGQCKITYKLNGKKRNITVVIKNKPQSASAGSQSGGGSSGGSAGGDGTVYWVDSGEVYHSTSSCRSLSRSRNIYSGPLSSCPKSRPCKNCH